MADCSLKAAKWVTYTPVSSDISALSNYTVLQWRLHKNNCTLMGEMDDFP